MALTLQVSALVYDVYTQRSVRRLIDHASFTWSSDHTIALMGRSGTGKSTLLSLLAGFERPTAGQIWYDNGDMTNATAHQWAALRASRMGFVFQSPLLIHELSVLENVMLRAIVQNKVTQAVRKEAFALLKELDIASLATQSTLYLSGGEQQRVAVARALCGGPEILFVDEPTAHLDETMAKALILLCKEAARARGMAMVVVTHDKTIAGDMDELWLMEKGKVFRVEDASYYSCGASHIIE